MSLGVSVPYQNADQAVVDTQADQIFYRQLGTVSVHVGINRVIAAAKWLAANGRGGTITWKVPGRVAFWEGVYVAPGLQGSPVMNIWLVGGALLQRNTVIIRQGWWTFALGPSLSGPIPSP
jgi:hypothetical protein